MQPYLRRLELKIPPLGHCLITVALIVTCCWLLPFATFPLPGKNWLALAVLLVSFAIMFSGVMHMRRKRTTLDPRDPSLSSQIVTDGIFRFTRNPIYLGMALALLGIAIWAANLAGYLAVAAFCCAITEWQIKPEERMLLQRFGAGYQEYTARVRRWL